MKYQVQFKGPDVMALPTVMREYEFADEAVEFATRQNAKVDQRSGYRYEAVRVEPLVP